MWTILSFVRNILYALSHYRLWWFGKLQICHCRIFFKMNWALDFAIIVYVSISLVDDSGFSTTVWITSFGLSASDRLFHLCTHFLNATTRLNWKTSLSQLSGVVAFFQDTYPNFYPSSNTNSLAQNMSRKPSTNNISYNFFCFIHGENGKLSYFHFEHYLTRTISAFILVIDKFLTEQLIYYLIIF